MQQLVHSFTGLTPPAEVVEAVRRGEIAAICLFAHRNVASPAQLRELTGILREAASQGGFSPPLIGIDQEGGQLVAITGGATELPGNMALGATRSPELVEKAGRILGRELLAMGINMNYAPALDVNVNPQNPVIGTRSFGDDPTLVSELGMALIRGIQAEGVSATAKHFPGHGDTRIDSHDAVPVVPHSLGRINEVELAPFRAAIAADVRAIMTAHILFPALDESRPATLSRRILDGVLRGEMGFDGLVITDAMDMVAVAEQGAQPSIQAAIEAGADLVLLAHLPEQFQMHQRARTWERSASIARIQRERDRSPRELPPLDVVGCAEHQEIAQTIADRSITLVRDHGVLPLQLAQEDEVAVITVKPVDLTPADTSSGVTIRLSEAVQRRHPRVRWLELAHHAPERDIHTILQACEDASAIIVGTLNADRDSSQANLVHAFWQRGQRPIVVALRTPYDLTAFPMVETYLCAYGIRAVTTEAIARVLFGEIEAIGILPCAIPGITLSNGIPH